MVNWYCQDQGRDNVIRDEVFYLKIQIQFFFMFLEEKTGKTPLSPLLLGQNPKVAGYLLLAPLRGTTGIAFKLQTK